MEQQKKFQEFFNELMETRGFNISRLSESADVPERYLAALCEGDFKKLPALPYVRGFIIQAAEALGVDGNEVWRVYKDEIIVKIGIEDKLPVNRFAGRSINKRKIAIGVIAFFAIIYLVWRIDDLLGIPKLEIIYPQMEVTTVNAPVVKLKGRLSVSRDKLTINNEEAFVSSDGWFEKDLTLEAGANVIEFKAKRFLGKEVKMTREIIYQQ